MKIKFKQQGGLLLLSGLAVVVVATMVTLMVANNTKSVPRSYEALNRAEYILSGFVFAHFRLPCPDTNADGLEDCDAGSTQGRLPYKTLGLISALRNEYGAHLHYAPYRKASATLKEDVDLTISKHRYIPDIAEIKQSFSVTLGTLMPTAIPPLSIFHKNLLDFCQALKYQKTLAYDASLPNIGFPATNLAIILVDPGSNTRLEGANATGNMSFAQPSQSQGINYDDKVKTLSFETLSAQFACVGLLSSLDLLAYSTHDASFAVDNANAAVEDAKTDRIMAGIDAALGGLSMLILGGQIIAAAKKSGIYSSLCVASLGVAANVCAGTGLAIAAGIAGGIALLASIASFAVQVAVAIDANNNVTKSKELLENAKETQRLLIMEAVYADMRGGVE